MKRLLSVAVLVFCVVGIGLAAAAHADDASTEAVRAANDAFYEALNAMFVGEIEPMKAVWSHASDITYMGPAGGFLVGWDAVGPTWEAQAALMLGGHIDARDTRITVGRDLAVVSTVEVGENTNPEIGSQTVSIRATNVFRLEMGVWKMIGHHTDLLPFLED
jgi:ketosteroid isomerase-like protein